MSLHFMPDYVEYIVKMKLGCYGIVNFMAEGNDKISLLCY